MARTLADCRLLLAAMAGPRPQARGDALHAPRPTRCPSAQRRGRSPGVRLAISPRTASVELDADVAAGFELALDACRRLGASLVEPPRPTPASTSVTTSSTC